MKKLIIAILIILFCSFQASAWNPMVMSSGNTGSAGESYAYIGTDNDPPSTSVGSQSVGGYTYIYDEASSVSGYIAEIKIAVKDNDPSGFQFAVFDCDDGTCTTTSGEAFTDEHTKEDFTLSGTGVITLTEGTDYSTNLFPIDAGQYFGWYQPANANIYRDETSGSETYWYYNGDRIGVSASTTFEQPFATRESQIRIKIRYTP